MSEFSWTKVEDPHEFDRYRVSFRDQRWPIWLGDEFAEDPDGRKARDLAERRIRAAVERGEGPGEPIIIRRSDVPPPERR